MAMSALPGVDIDCLIMADLAFMESNQEIPADRVRAAVFAYEYAKAHKTETGLGWALPSWNEVHQALNAAWGHPIERVTTWPN